MDIEIILDVLKRYRITVDAATDEDAFNAAVKRFVSETDQEFEFGGDVRSISLVAALHDGKED